MINVKEVSCVDRQVNITYNVAPIHWTLNGISLHKVIIQLERKAERFIHQIISDSLLHEIKAEIQNELCRLQYCGIISDDKVNEPTYFL